MVIGFSVMTLRAELHRARRCSVVQVVGHGDDQHVRLLLGNHPVEFVGAVGGDRLAADLADLAGGQLQPVRVESHRPTSWFVSAKVEITASRNIR